METTKMNFVELRKSMVSTILSGVEDRNASEWAITGLWMTWKTLNELYHNESMYWCVSGFTEGLYCNLPEDWDRYRIVCKITRVGKREYEVEVVKVAD